MRCPTCIQDKTRSRVENGGAPGWGLRSTSLVHHVPNAFYDEDGRFHEHSHRDMNERHFKCSLGHLFEVVMKKGCWCGHGRIEPRVTTKDSNGRAVPLRDNAVLTEMFKVTAPLPTGETSHDD